jgi:hypothetical protein
MSSITVDISRQARHYRVALAIDGQIQPRAVFGCTDGLEPMLRGLMAAESEVAAVWTRPEGAVRLTPPTVTIGMPSGSVLTFTLTTVQHAMGELPEGAASVIRTMRDG